MTMSFYSKFKLNIIHIVSVHKQVHRFSLFIVLVEHNIIVHAVHGIELTRQITYVQVPGHLATRFIVIYVLWFYVGRM